MNTLAGLVGVLIYALQILIYIIVAQAILSWLVAFNVVNTSNRFVWSVVDGLDRFLAPLLGPIRRRMPDFGGIDFSPLLLILAIILLQRLLEGLAMDLLIR
jgi:YggT family protein